MATGAGKENINFIYFSFCNIRYVFAFYLQGKMPETIDLHDGKVLFWVMVTVYGWPAGCILLAATLFILVGSM